MNDVSSSGRPPLLQHPPWSFRLRKRFEPLTAVVTIRNRKRRREADAFLLSYPKTGRTWLRVMLAHLLAEHFGRPEVADMAMQTRIRAGAGVPRIVVRHDGNPHKCTAAELCPHRREYAGCRVMLLVRDPRDAIVSNYFQVTRRDHWFEGDLPTFLRWPRGSLDSMLRYYDVWAKERAVTAGFLLLRYEDLRRDTAGELRRMATFLGLERIADSTIQRAVEHASFESMRRRESTMPADSAPLAPGHHDDPESFKVRRGKIGGYRDYLSADDVDWLDRRIDADLDTLYGYGSTARRGAAA
jgi:Sulfotransferase domain